MTTVGIYVRLSQDREGQTSTARQQADCEALAASRDWTVHRVYTDVDLSGYTGVARPGFDELLTDLQVGTIDGVIAWKLDRLSRNRGDWHRLATLVDDGATLACVQDPVDTSTTMGQVVVDMLASMARAESANTSTRVKRANEERAEAGLPHPSGVRAFGYRRDWTIDQAEARVVREAAERIIAGESLHGICVELNDRGITTSGGGRWRGWTLARMLRSPHVAGIRKHHDQLYLGTWEPILDRGTWERVGQILAHRGRSHSGGGRLKHLLSGGLLACGECGATMTSRPREDGTVRYICRRDIGGCGHVGILGPPLENLLRDMALTALDGDGLANALHALDDDHTSELVGQVADAEARLEELAQDYYGDGMLTRAEFVAARKRLEETIEAARSKLSASSSVLGGLEAGRVREWWAATGRTVDQRRALLASVFELVEVGPAVRGRNYFDAGRLTFRWRI